jgi:hypothetical protein
MQKRPYSLPCRRGFWLDGLWLDGLRLDGRHKELDPLNQKTVISWGSTPTMLNEAPKCLDQRLDLTQFFLEL